MQVSRNPTKAATALLGMHITQNKVTTSYPYGSICMPQTTWWNIGTMTKDTHVLLCAKSCSEGGRSSLRSTRSR